MFRPIADPKEVANALTLVKRNTPKSQKVYHNLPSMLRLTADIASGTPGYISYFPNEDTPENVLIYIEKTLVNSLYFISNDLIRMSGMVSAEDSNLPAPLVLQDIDNGMNGIQYPWPCIMVLMQMMRLGTTVVKSQKLQIRDANIDEMDEIYRILTDNFNVLAENIPEKSEIMEMITEKSVRVYSRGSEVQGLMIYSLSGKTIELRYIWVDPSERKKGIGSELMNDFFRAGKNTTKQCLWVQDSNQKAIDLYHKYGFGFGDALSVRYNRVYQIK